ncbi:MAG: iron ABC transporter permease [Treponema sp.]|nr:iron ABC transporter permease [Treponema sp.]
MKSNDLKITAFKAKSFFPLLILFLGAALVLSLSLGRYPIPPLAILGRIFGHPFENPRMEAVFFNVRLPRVILSCFVGCCLAAAGAGYQGVFQNPLAAPDILGASSGAALGASAAILLQLPRFMITVFAFVASLLTIILVMFIGDKSQGKKVIGLILAGLMVSSLISAGNSFIKLVADPNKVLPEIVYWLMGSLAKTTPRDIAFAIPPMLLGLIPLFFFRWRINVLTMGDDEAQSMGINVKRTRVIIIMCSTLVTAAAVSVSGIIGWAGLVIPHLCRRITGNDYRNLMPGSMLIGAIFLLLVDNISRNLFATEIPVGILTSLIGAPFFLWLVTRKGDLW